MIQPNNNISTTSYDPNCKDLTISTPNTNKKRQLTLESNKSDKRRRSQRKRTLSSISSFISTKSQRSTRSYRSYWKRNHLPWVLAPLARRTIQTTQSIISVTMPPLKLSDDEILQKIYDRAKTDTTNQRNLQSFWDEYCEWLKICKNLEDSQSQVEYWKAKDDFLQSNKYLKDQINCEPIPKTKFQPPMPESVKYLNELSDKLVTTKLGLLTYLKFFFLILQYILNIVFISQQLDEVINFDSNSLSRDISKSINVPKTRQEYIKSSIGIGYLVEFSFLAILIFITIFQFITFISSNSVINKGILCLNTIIAVQETAEFSLFKFIHLLNPSSYITEFHEPPLLDTISDFTKFTLHLQKYEPKIILCYKIFYTVIIKPLFSVLGLMALYIKLLQVSSSLEWLNRLNYDVSVFVECWNNHTYVINFLGLANNIAGLYGLQPNEERQAFFINHRIHEYDFVYALLTEYYQNDQLYKGYWNIALYAVGIDHKDLIEIFWEAVYGEFPDIYDDDESIVHNDIENA